MMSPIFRNRGPLLITVTIIVSMALFVNYVMIRGIKRSRELERQSLQYTYASWCKLKHRTDLSFEEWSQLRRERLLK